MTSEDIKHQFIILLTSCPGWTERLSCAINGLKLQKRSEPFLLAAVAVSLEFNVTECIVYMFRAIPFNLFFPVLFLFDWVGFYGPII